MPRVRREKCPNSIYHVIVRGNNREDIFRDYADRISYLKRLKRYKEKFKMEVYAYCLMTNHVHLVIYDNGQNLSKFMQGLSLSYAIYFNKKYDRSGHVFQGRFTSLMVRSDEYFIYVSKYVHRNPVKANIVEDALQYNWSSFKAYIKERDKLDIVSTNRLLKYFSDNKRKAKKLYLAYIRNVEDEGEAEVASALEKSYSVQSDETQKLKEVSVDRIFEVAEQRFKVSKVEIVQRNNIAYRYQRDICIYLVALLTRMSYEKIGEIFGVKAAAIGISIKRNIERMIKDEYVLNRINEVIKIIYS